MNGLFKTAAILSRIAEKLGELLLLLCGVGMVCDISLQVFFRYVLNDSLFWSEELGRILLVWLTFFGASVAYKRGAHIGVDVLVSRFSAPVQRILRVFSHLVCLCFFAVILFYGTQFLGFLKFQSTTTLGISKQLPFLTVPVSAAFLLLHGLYFLLRDLRGKQA
ncbi:TRAP transporter small permease [Desulfobaculum bizertense]|uniref:TRAP-type C4-dicarboxylate transport system, small permease component n=1 Tax=Desulfobaculum bizertense DSM 18034 TaxID=1121442 RepID=A0A1T4VWB7_9BACT|nr:TRAP transporter small permease [Desulfobaculum bizertense]UIJ36800.1 TRAP transporter small permease [Desulfobaculum bizertense]SKA69310.1 TRAP-type C4-dicarboxylate transport system, small permease component [Desulfobaculum bizertense DSM 18034]